VWLVGCAVIRDRASDDVVDDTPTLTCFKNGVCRTNVKLGPEAVCPVQAIALDDQTCVVRGGPIRRKHAAPIDDDSESLRTVACGELTRVCESKLKCDCSTVLPVMPCEEGFQKSRAITLRNRDGSACEAFLRAPSHGSCWVDVSYRDGRSVTDGNAVIPLGTSGEICGLRVRCTCESLAPTGGSSAACLVLSQSEPEAGRCLVEYEECTGADCKLKRVQLNGGSSAEVCGQKFGCPPPAVEF
jgi:hypothetical protein